MLQGRCIMDKASYKALLYSKNKSVAMAYKICELSIERAASMVQRCVVEYCELHDIEIECKDSYGYWFINGKPSWAFKSDLVLMDMISEMNDLVSLREEVQKYSSVYRDFLLLIEEEEGFSLGDLETESEDEC